VAVTAPLLVEPGGDRVVVTLHRPERRNALGLETIEALHEVISDLERQPRFLVLTGGADGVFVGGADIAELARRDADDAMAGINLRLFDRLAALPLPTVAAIDGPAIGGGAELAYSCDIRIVTPRTFFAQPEPGLGIIAGAGAAWRLPGLVGSGVARDMLFTGRRIGGEEATRIGLASRLVAPDELLTAAHAVVDTMAASSQQALRFMKLAVGVGSDGHPAVDLLAQAVLFDSDDKRARMAAFLERRARG
jgi:enoyl-CoA hydratase/carnithine racemase